MRTLAAAACLTLAGAGCGGDHDHDHGTGGSSAGGSGGTSDAQGGAGGTAAGGAATGGTAAGGAGGTATGGTAAGGAGGTATGGTAAGGAGGTDAMAGGTGGTATGGAGGTATGGAAAGGSGGTAAGGAGGVAAITSTWGRLVVGDFNREAPRFVVFDLDDGQKLTEFRTLGAPRVYSSEPGSGYAWISQRDGDLVEILASGITAQGAGVVKMTPWLLDERFVAAKPTHWVMHEHWVVSFNDGDGSFDYVLENTLGTRRPLMRRSQTGKAHHGVAVISHGNVFATIPNPDPMATSTLPIGVSRRFLATPDTIADRAETCPGLHGEASNEEAVAFGCTDGILLWERKDGAFTHRHLPNPADTPMGRRVGTIRMKDGFHRLIGNWGNGFVIVSYREATPTWIPVDIGSANRGFYLEYTGDRLIVLGGDGNLHAFNATTGARIGTPLPVMDAWPTMGLPQGMPTPNLRLGDGFAYVTDPRTGMVHEINLTTWAKTRAFNVGGWPASVTAFGRWRASAN